MSSLSQSVSEQWLQFVGVPAHHPAGDRVGEGDGLGDRCGSAAGDLPHGSLLQHLRTTQRTL